MELAQFVRVVIELPIMKWMNNKGVLVHGCTAVKIKEVTNVQLEGWGIIRKFSFLLILGSYESLLINYTTSNHSI